MRFCILNHKFGKQSNLNLCMKCVYTLMHVYKYTRYILASYPAIPTFFAYKKLGQLGTRLNTRHFIGEVEGKHYCQNVQTCRDTVKIWILQTTYTGMSYKCQVLQNKGTWSQEALCCEPK